MFINLQAEMESRGIALDVRSFTALVGAAALAGGLERARQLFDSMAGESDFVAESGACRRRQCWHNVCLPSYIPWVTSICSFEPVRNRMSQLGPPLCRIWRGAQHVDVQRADQGALPRRLARRRPQGASSCRHGACRTSLGGVAPPDTFDVTGHLPPAMTSGHSDRVPLRHSHTRVEAQSHEGQGQGWG